MSQELREQILAGVKDRHLHREVDAPRILEVLQLCEIANFDAGTKDERRDLCYFLCLLLRDLTPQDNPLILQKTEALLLKFAGVSEHYFLTNIWESDYPPLVEDFIVRHGWLKPESWVREASWRYNMARQHIRLALKRGEFGEVDAFYATYPFPNYCYILAFALSNHNPDIRRGAWTYCRKLDDYRRSLINITLTTDEQSLDKDKVIDWLVEQRFYSPERAYPRVVITLINDEYAAHNTETGVVVQILIRLVMNNKHPKYGLPDKAREALSRLQTATGRNLLCDYILGWLRTAQDCYGLDKVALQAGYEPAKLQDKALFFFLTGAFEKYDAIDFDHQIMKTIHATSNSSLRNIITKVVRMSGRIDYLDIISHISVLSDQSNYQQQKTTLRILRANDQWARLWEKVFEFNYWGSLSALGILKKSGWQPPTEYERELFARLKAILVAGLPTGKLQIQPAELVEQAFGTTKVEFMTLLKTAKETASESPAPVQNMLKYIETVLHHRFQHDIEVEFAPEIQPGQFDVEIES
jgi:hypothetical protein